MGMRSLLGRNLQNWIQWLCLLSSDSFLTEEIGGGGTAFSVNFSKLLTLISFNEKFRFSSPDKKTEARQATIIESFFLSIRFHSRIDEGTYFVIDQTEIQDFFSGNCIFSDQRMLMPFVTFCKNSCVI